MEEHIDKIVQRSETEKSISVRPELWDRLERQLDNTEGIEMSFARKSRKKRPKGIVGSKWLAAASLALIVTIISAFFLQMNSYTLEELNNASEPYFTKEDLNGMEALYLNQERLLLNIRPS